MNNLKEVNKSITRIHVEIIKLLTQIANVMDHELNLELEQEALQQTVRNFEICKEQLEILKTMLTLKVLLDQ